jgi:hypothetical protein
MKTINIKQSAPTDGYYPPPQSTLTDLSLTHLSQPKDSTAHAQPPTVTGLLPEVRPKYRSEITCDCCCEILDLTEFESHITNRCDHVNKTCKKCLDQWIDRRFPTCCIVDGIPCPQCGLAMNFEDMRRCCSESQFERYDHALLLQSLSRSPTFFWCISPTCPSGQFHEYSSDTTFECIACNTRHCTVHGTFHDNETCAQYESRLHAAHNKASEDTIAKTCKNCPKCKAPTLRDGGCDHMVCTRCQYEWCWLCGTDWQQHRYRNPNCGLTEELFPPTEQHVNQRGSELEDVSQEHGTAPTGRGPPSNLYLERMDALRRRLAMARNRATTVNMRTEDAQIIINQLEQIEHRLDGAAVSGTNSARSLHRCRRYLDMVDRQLRRAERENTRSLLTETTYPHDWTGTPIDRTISGWNEVMPGAFYPSSPIPATDRAIPRWNEVLPDTIYDRYWRDTSIDRTIPSWNQFPGHEISR